MDATHDFVADADRDAIQDRLASEYLPAVRLTVAERDGVVVGFAGTNEGALEMLFVDTGARGSGVGSALLRQVIAEDGVTRVDVNEQNAAAAAFYARRGFVVTGRSEQDEAGRPYPLLHLSLRAARDAKRPLPPER